MSRTYKRAGGSVGLTTGNNSPWKRVQNRKYRRKVNQHLNENDWEDIPDFREVSDIWDSPSDGKLPVGDAPAVPEGYYDHPKLAQYYGWNDDDE